MRAYPAYAIILFIAIATSVQPAAAYTQMGIPFITTCDTMYMVPTELATASISEFNSMSLAETSMETLDIDFPTFADGVHLGPVTGISVADGVALGAGATSNVLPFGPVNLAFPSIGQTADETCVYQRTYFFTDTGPP